MFKSLCLFLVLFGCAFAGDLSAQECKSPATPFTQSYTPIPAASQSASWFIPPMNATQYANRVGLNSTVIDRFFTASFKLDPANCINVSWAEITMVVCPLQSCTKTSVPDGASCNDGWGFSVTPGQPISCGYVYPNGLVKDCITIKRTLNSVELAALNTSDMLNVYLQDDSKVTSIVLTVRGCKGKEVLETTCNCPRGWLSNSQTPGVGTTNVDGGATDTKYTACKKKVCGPISIKPPAANGTQIGNWGFTWDGDIWVYGTAANGGAVICNQRKVCKP
jgi:hypothetical protein